MTYKSVSDNLDKMLQYRNIFQGSKTIQTICAAAMVESSAFLCSNPDTIVFDDDGLVIDFMYDSIFDSACRKIEALVKAVKARRAAAAMQTRRAA